jgi:hypothetical protein
MNRLLGEPMTDQVTVKPETPKRGRDDLNYYTIKERSSMGRTHSYVVVKQSEFARLKGIDEHTNRAHIAEFFINAVSSDEEAMFLATRLAFFLEDAELDRRTTLLKSKF